jgi:hypothetical protein
VCSLRALLFYLDAKAEKKLSIAAARQGTGQRGQRETLEHPITESSEVACRRMHKGLSEN